MAEYSSNAFVAGIQREVNLLVELYMANHPECKSREDAEAAIARESEELLSTNCISRQMSDDADALAHYLGWC